MASRITRSVPDGATISMTGAFAPTTMDAAATAMALPAAMTGDAAMSVMVAVGTEIDLPAASCGASAART